MNTKELEKICHEVTAIVRETAVFIKSHAGKVSKDQIEHKSLNSLVSFVDKSAENILIAELKRLLPDAGFIAEESDNNNTGSKLVWVIDPLDGTTNFLHGLPFFAISVALVEEGEAVIGVVHDVMHDNTFYAWKGGGAFADGKSISVSTSEQLSDCLTATGFPYFDFSIVEPYLRCLRVFMKQTRGIRRIGSAALDLAYVACGRFDFFFEYKLNTWDIAAGIVLVREAGGTVTGLTGKDDMLQHGSILAANKNIHTKALEVIKPEFKSYI